MVWLEVRVLPAPPRILANPEISWQPPNGPQLAGFALAVWSLLRPIRSTWRYMPASTRSRIMARYEFGKYAEHLKHRLP